MSGERKEVGAEFLHVRCAVGHGLAAVDHADCTGLASSVSECANRVHCSEHIRHCGDRENLGAIEKRVELGEIKAPFGVERDPTKLNSDLGNEHVPRNDVGVVLHVTEHDDIAGRKICSSPALRNHIESFGCILGEDDFGGRPRANEIANKCSSEFHAVRGFFSDHVNATMHIRINRAVVVVHRIQNRKRLLRSGRRVEIDDRLSVHLARKERELCLHCGPVDRVEAYSHASYPSASSLRESSGPPDSTMRPLMST